MRLPCLRTPLSAAIISLFSANALAADLDVTIQIPQLEVAEYHRPYVAVWLEKQDKSVASNLAVWYQQKRGGAGGGAGAPGPRPEAGPKPPEAAKPEGGPKPEGGKPAAGPQAEGGTKWLPDLRQWWRRSGRELSVPIDGVTGATRNVGEHKLSFAQGKAPLGELAPGQYQLVVEAAREDGGRELLDIPFTWPATSAQELKAQGKSELGAVTLALKP
jgi:hypothetical protein